MGVNPVAIKYNQAGLVKVTFNIPASIEPGKYIIDFKGTATPTLLGRNRHDKHKNYSNS